MSETNSRRARSRARSLRAGAAAASAITVAVGAVTLLAGAPAVSAKAFPTHPFVPGSVVIADTTYPAQGDPLVQRRPEPALRFAGGHRRRATPRRSTTMSTPTATSPSPPRSTCLTWIRSATSCSQTKVPTDQVDDELLVEVRAGDQLLDQRPGSELLGVQRGAEHARRVELQHAAGARPDQPGSRRPVQPGLRRPRRDGGWSFTDSNAFSGDNGRAVLLNNATARSTPPATPTTAPSTTQNAITDSGGAQGVRAVVRVAGRSGARAAPITRLGNFTFSTKDKFGKDTNFRGLTVFDDVVY